MIATKDVVLICGTNALRREFSDEQAQKIAREHGLTDVEIQFVRWVETLNDAYQELGSRLKLIIDLGQMRQAAPSFDMTVETEDTLQRDAKRLGVQYHRQE